MQKLDWEITIPNFSSSRRKNPGGYEGMNKVVQRKKIIIPFSGYIHALGVHGPVEIPYMETLETIAKLLMRRIPVYEITSDGNKVKLTTTNYKKNNGGNGDDVRKTYEPVNSKRKKNTTIPISSEDLEKKSLSTILRNSTKQVSQSKDYYVSDKKKKNKHQKDEQNPVYVGVVGSSVDSDLVEVK